MSVKSMKNGIYVLKDNKCISSFIEDVANISDQEKAFIVCDIGEIVKRYQEWRNALPRITPFYAVKCNDDNTVLKTLSALGAGFDCSSKLEINKVLEIGVETDRIIYAHATKIISHIRHAAAVNVSLMTFDNEQELYKIKKYYPDSRLVLRFRCDDETAVSKLGIKFGCDPYTEAPQLLKVARKLDLNIVGTCFCVGSHSRNPQIFQTAISYAKDIFNFAKTVGYNFSILDIGGGYPGGRGATIDVFAKVINDALAKYFPDTNIKIISEPGSFLVATSSTIVTNIHSLRTVKNRDDTGNISLHNMYYVNDGFFGSFNSVLSHGYKVHAEPLKEKQESLLISSSIWGPTCDCIDKICDMMLPQMNIGDWLMFHDLGNYTFKAASEFNGFLKPNIYFVIEESKWCVLRNTVPFTGDDFITDNNFGTEVINTE